MSRLPHFLDSQLIDGGKVVSLMQWPSIAPRKIPGTYFCQRMSLPQGHSAAVRIRSTEKSSDLIRNQTRNLPACSVVSQSTIVPHALHPLVKILRVYKDGYTDHIVCSLHTLFIISVAYYEKSD
jgi:hypothetical protein